MSAFHSGSYTSFLTRQCLNIVLVKVKKRYLWWKLKYPEIKPRKKHSKKLFSEVYIHFRVLKQTLSHTVWKLCLWGNCEGILSDTPRLVVRKETSSDENGRETFGAKYTLLCKVCIHLIEWNRSLDWAVLNRCFCDIRERTFGNALNNMLKKKYRPIKARRKLSVKLL